MTLPRLRYLGLTMLVVVPVLFSAGIWFAGNQLLYPSWSGATKDLSRCPPVLAAVWGEGCGNLRLTRALQFREIAVPSLNGYDLPGWLIGAADNRREPAIGAILLVHGGGSDRREVTRHASFFLDRRLDVLTVDLGCHGEAPCPVPGLSYGERESQDIVSAYLYLAGRYQRVLAMGSSVGAASVLIALPAMPKLAGVIAENPMASFERLIRETPAAAVHPWLVQRTADRQREVAWSFRRLAQSRACAAARSRHPHLLHPQPTRRDRAVPAVGATRRPLWRAQDDLVARARRAFGHLGRRPHGI